MTRSCPKCNGTGWLTLFTSRERCECNPEPEPEQEESVPPDPAVPWPGLAWYYQHRVKP